MIITVKDFTTDSKRTVITGSDGKKYSYWVKDKAGNKPDFDMTVQGGCFECEIKENVKDGTTYRNIVSAKRVENTTLGMPSHANASPRQEQSNGFAMSYTKDIVVALINKGIDESKVSIAIENYFILIKGLMENKDEVQP